MKQKTIIKIFIIILILIVLLYLFNKIQEGATINTKKTAIIVVKKFKRMKIIKNGII
jgi:hypothetical protein